MKSILLHIDPILRGESRADLATYSRRTAVERISLMLLCAMIYGGVMGSWGLFASGMTNAEQWLSVSYSALKVPLLLAATFLLSLPVLFISYTLAGRRSDFNSVLHGLMQVQSGVAIILGGLAPLTAVWYASVRQYESGVLFNGVMFAISTLAAPLLVRRKYHLLIARDPRNRWLLRLWLALYIFIGIQMGWTLRPFIGSPGSRAEFVRWEELSNAYVVLVEMIERVMGW